MNARHDTAPQEAVMPFRRALAVLLALLLAGPAAAGAQSARPVGNAPAPALSTAALQLLELVQLQVDDAAVELGSALIVEHPHDAALHALYAAALSRYGGRDEAVELSAQYAVRWPDDAWVLAVRGVLMWTHTSGTAADAAEARKLAERARQLAPDDPYVASWVVSIYSAYPRYEQAIALADSFIANGHASAELRYAKAAAMEMLGRMPAKPDTAMQSRAYGEYAAAREQGPHHPGTYLAEGRWLLSARRPAEALLLLERAVQLSPHSNPIRRAYWDGISARSDIGVEEKRSLVRADMEAYLGTRGHALGARYAVAQHLFMARDFERLAPLYASIERDHAGTWQAAQVILDRALLSADSARRRSTSAADSMAVHRRIADDMRSVLEMPGLNSSVRSTAIGRLYRALSADSTSSVDELLSVFGEYDRWHVREKHIRLPALLAERGAHLDLAEELARGALDAVQEYDEQYEQWPEWFTVAELADWMDNGAFGAHSTLGWVLFHRGDLAEAKRQLEKAHDIVNTHPVAPYRLGRIAEAEGDIETAERWYASGRGREDWYRNSSDALERLYRNRHGSLEGFETYLAAIDERELVRRRAKVESDRIAEPEPLPDFEHDWMNGGRFSSESLDGKVAVINFWGVWCGPCVREAPEIQAFAEAIRDHPDVVFITVANDNDLDTTRDFMKEKGFDFPVIFDEGIVRMVNISGFPTTLFVDRDGRVVFRYVGASLRLVEEYTLRVEALLGQTLNEATGGESSSTDLETAIARVRSLYFAHDFHHGAAEGEAALERWPESGELLAWTSASLSRSRSTPPSSAYSTARAAETVARAESLVASRPDDVWGAIALALALTHHPDRRGEALEASLRPLELAPTMPEAVWVRGVILHNARQYGAVASLIEEKWPVVDRPWVELLALQADAWLAMRISEGPERLAAGLAILDRARQLDPENVNAHYLAGRAVLEGGNVLAYYLGGTAVLESRRVEEAAALLDRAAALSPGATEIAAFRWRAIQADPDRDAEEKKVLIGASANRLLELRGHHPGILRSVAGHLSFFGLTAEAAELQDRVVAEFAHTVDAEAVLANRWERLAGRLSSGQVGDTVSAGVELSSMLWSFIDRPRHHQPELLGNAYKRLFGHVRRDETVSPDTLLLLAHGAAEHNRSLPHAELAIGLAERGAHLDAARRLARDGIDAAEEHVSRRIDSYKTPGDAADALDRALASVYAAIGYVELEAGDLVASREATNRALELKPDIPEVQFRAGALAEAEGDNEAAEIHYAWGDRYERLRPGRDKPNRHALVRIFTARHGSMEGYDAFIAGIDDRDRVRRRLRIANSRIDEPRDLPIIDLEWLHGGRIGADELEGRIVVINFWGIWCGPCVAEAPQLQQFHEKYRDDPGVVFLTIDAFDPDLDKVRSWMVENKYDYPVLIDDNFVLRHGVRSYPTTWFVGADGRIAFEYSGVSAAVFEEFVWRVEMLQAEAAPRAISHADLSAQSNVYTVPLTYNTPGEGPRPNWGPSATRVRLTELPAGQTLPAGAVQPARRGVVEVGPTAESWIPLLLTATAGEPGVFTRLYLDLNRNGDFSDDGPPAVATLERAEKTGDLRHSFGDIELPVRFSEPERTVPFGTSFWFVQSPEAAAPDTIIRYTNRSWRSGSVTINGVPALVMALDASKDALYGPGDSWSVVEASMPEASRHVLSWREARTTDRLMFLQRGDEEPDMVLEFRSFAQDGSSITFAVADYEMSKAEDRLADDMVAEERTRPRATTTYTWTDDLDGAIAAAQASGQRVFLYFETDWCGPCKIMDEWIWTDAEVVAALEDGFVGVKLDGDIAREQVRRYEVVGYPNILIVDPASGSALRSVRGYQSSQQLLDFLRR
jgi:thiol-disulfide isomerase/thioredoxin